MADFSPPDQNNTPEKAQQYFNNGVYLKSQGQTDKALTEFRRAVIANPNYFQAHLEIGGLCKVKANSDPLFKKYAYEAYKKAASLNLTDQVAHDQYISTSHQMGKLEQVYEEYKELQKKHPNNELFKRCTKNILTMTMALIPENVSIESHTGRIRKAIFIVSILVFFSGIGLIIAPPLANKFMSLNLSKEDMGRMAKAGMGLMVLSGVGFVVRSKIN